MKVDVAKLRELRQRRVLSMRELEGLSGVSYNTIWRLENGFTEARPRKIRRLAAALGMKPEELVRVRSRD